MKSKLDAARYFSPVVAIVGALMVPISASHADTFTLVANLTGSLEVPPVATPGTGSVILTLDTTLHTTRQARLAADRFSLPTRRGSLRSSRIVTFEYANNTGPHSINLFSTPIHASAVKRRPSGCR